MSKKGIKIFKWGVLALLLAYAACITVWAHSEARKHVCTGVLVKVDGHPALDSIIRQGVYEELKDYPRPIKGAQLQSINTVDIEKYLTRTGTFESVNCMVSARGELVVRILPLVPVMRVFCGNKSYYVNKEGRHIETNAEYFSDVPVVSGKFKHGFQPRDVLPLVNYIRKDETLGSLVSMIVAENKYNLILVPRIKGHVVNFGDTTRLDDKKKALAMFYRQVIPYKGWEEYDTISVKYRGQVVATRRDKSRVNHTEEYVEQFDMEEGTLPGADPEPATTQKPDTTGNTARHAG